VISRTAAGLLLAVFVAGVGVRAGALTPAGAAVAAAIGTLAVAAGWPLAILLILFFIASSALSRAGEARKATRVRGIVAKGGARDASQVLANGGVFAVAAGAAILLRSDAWMVAAIGALAASTADTWGTEIGTLVGGTPRLVTTWRRVPPGSSGAISVPGMLATAAGAAFIAAAILSLGWTRTDGAAVFAGGLAGALADSVLGATVQARRRCTSCDMDTEQRTHVCGAATRPTGGLAWLENDAVNLISSAVGAVVAASLSR
jgi:uncharacterized protein (TIGR00297 family)